MQGGARQIHEAVACDGFHGGITVNWDQIEGSWKQLMGQARQKWGKLTDDELKQTQGRRDELIGKVQKKYGFARDQAEREVESWSRDVHV